MKKENDDSSSDSESESAPKSAKKEKADALESGSEGSEEKIDSEMLQHILDHEDEDSPDEKGRAPSSGSEGGDYDRALLEKILQKDDDEDFSSTKKKSLEKAEAPKPVERITDPLLIIDRHETRTRFERRPELVQHLEDNKLYTTMDISRMNYTEHKRVVQAFATPEVEKLAGEPTCISVRLCCSLL